MTSLLILQLLFMTFLLVLSAFFSGAETALMKLSKIKVKHWIHTRTANFEAWANWLSNPQDLITTILVGNTLVNIVFSSFAAWAAMDRFKGIPQELVQTLAGIAAFLLVLVFGEIVPKIYCRQNPEKVSSISLPPLFRLSKFLAAPLKGFLEFVARFSPILKEPAPGRVSTLTLDEIRAIIQDRSALRGLEAEHQEMMRKVLDMHHITVGQIMTPWKDVDFLILDDALAGGEKHERFIDELIESGRTRLPCAKLQSSWLGQEKSTPKVVGYLLVNDLLSSISQDRKIEPIFFQKCIRKIPTVLGDKKISDVLDIFRFGCPMACVQDRKGFPIGIVTLEDILEELVGEILDEYDIESSERGKS